MKKIKIEKHKSILHLTYAFLIIGCLCVSCDAIRVSMDKSGLSDVAASVLDEWRTSSNLEISGYTRDLDVTKDVYVMPPESITVSGRDNWLLDTKAVPGLIQERIGFQSCIEKPDGSFDESIFYTYRKGDWTSQKVILWIPGFGVSDFAFQFIRKFFYAELEHGYAIVFYNIPYHLERIAQGRKSGEGFISSDPVTNIKLFRSCLCEIRTIVAYIKEKGITSVSGWGGSIGAALLWYSSASFSIDHMTLMIPIVDWNTIIFGDSFAKVIERYGKEGVDEYEVRRAYENIGPMFLEPGTKKERIQILYATKDQLTPEGSTLAFARKWGITNIKSYNESHATILCNESMYADYSLFLDKIR